MRYVCKHPPLFQKDKPVSVASVRHFSHQNQSQSYSSVTKGKKKQKTSMYTSVSVKYCHGDSDKNNRSLSTYSYQWDSQLKCAAAKHRVIIHLELHVAPNTQLYICNHACFTFTLRIWSTCMSAMCKQNLQYYAASDMFSCIRDAPW